MMLKTCAADIDESFTRDTIEENATAWETTVWGLEQRVHKVYQDYRITFFIGRHVITFLNGFENEYKVHYSFYLVL